jgi:7-cyano-7-deazaguanine reductase
MPRHLAREEYSITGEEFTGYDVWHCHESTFLLNNGIPVAGTLKIIYPANSKYMVESKSIKLYLNTFDMCKMGYTIDAAIINYKNQVCKDLSKILETNVMVFFHKNNADQKAIDPVKGYEDIYDYLNDKIYYMKDIEYNGDITYSITEKNNKANSIKNSYPVKLSTNVLRSRCRHTKQKDTGSAYIQFIVKPGYKINVENVLRQILQLREKNEFHEFCSEVLFTKFIGQEGIEDVMVSLLYARRGSLDINPVRTSNIYMIPEVMKNPEIYTKKTMGQ